MLLSIIIPTRNEADQIGSQIAHLQSLALSEKMDMEIIVCDGGSEDATVAIANGRGTKIMQTAPNRGLQQNAGARVANGEFLWFLHADVRPHRNSLAFLKAMSLRRSVSGGNFRLRFDQDTLATRTFAVIAGIQRMRGIYYGDSGIWVRREVFDLMGGFRGWPLFEDFDFVKRLESFSHRHGMRTHYSHLPITVSSRRLEKFAGTVLMQWLALQCLFSLGAPPEKLARLYFGR